MSRYKVLQLDWQRDWEDEIQREMLEETLAGYKQIEPVFNRPGWYYDRREKRVWFECDGRAWQDKRLDDFLYKFKLLDHQPLNQKVREALKTLVAHNFELSKQARVALYWDNNQRELKRVVRDTKRWIIRFRKEEEETT